MSIYNTDYTEVDSSPMATQQSKFFAELAAENADTEESSTVED